MIRTKHMKSSNLPVKTNNHLEKIDGRSSNLEEKLFSHSFSLMFQLFSLSRICTFEISYKL